jgi:hypothetical protein
MMEIRDNYELKKNWMGDPCAPKAFAWVGLNCGYSSSDLQKRENGSLVLRSATLDHLVNSYLAKHPLMDL